MKQKLAMFAVCQIFFMGLFVTSALEMASHDGLQPIESSTATYRIRLNESVDVRAIEKIATDNNLNIAYYDNSEDEQKYYIRFSFKENPVSIYGVDTNAFLADNFHGAICASTVRENNCEIELSSPDKSKKITIHSLDSFATSDIDNIIFYPQDDDVLDDVEQLFKGTYPATKFISDGMRGAHVLDMIVIVFVLANTLILVATLQEVFRRGKRVGLAKLFGDNFKQRCLYPLALTLFIVTSIAGMSYFLLWQFLTFDFAYLRYVLVYDGVVLSLYIVCLTFIHLHVDQQNINLLIKGMQRSKFLMGIFVLVCSVCLFVSGFLVPTLSRNVRLLTDEYEKFSYYQEFMEHAGTIGINQEGFLLLRQRDPVFVEQNSKMKEYFGEHLVEKTRMDILDISEIFSDDMTSFPAFHINKNLVLQYFSNEVETFDLDDMNTSYLFVSDVRAQADAVKAWQDGLAMGREPHPQAVVIEYGDRSFKELTEDKTGRGLGESSLGNLELTNPIYRYKAPQPFEEQSETFASAYGAGGYYIDLASPEAQEKWYNTTQMLEQLGLTAYYNAPETLAQIEGNMLANYWTLIILTVIVFCLSTLGMVLLIYTSLKEYFRVNRKKLVLEKVFGTSFVHRYGRTMAGILSVFTVGWGFGTFLAKEKMFLNVGLFGVSFVLLYLFVYRRIQKLEYEAINIVIKE